MSDTTRLIEMLKVLKGSWIGDGIHPSIATSAIIDALEQQAAQIAEQAAEITRLRDIASDAADDACINALRKENGVGLRPCRSPYCECDPGKCTHPGCYDARHEPLPT